jgi:hypothetical protein
MVHGPSQTWLRLTLWVKSRWPISNTRGMYVTRDMDSVSLACERCLSARFSTRLGVTQQSHDRLCWVSRGGQFPTPWKWVSPGEWARSRWPSNIVCHTAFTRVFDLPNRVTTSFTLVGNSADSPEPLFRLSPATGHVAKILDVSDPDMGYDAETCPYQPPQ